MGTILTLIIIALLVRYLMKKNYQYKGKYEQSRVDTRPVRGRRMCFDCRNCNGKVYPGGQTYCKRSNLMYDPEAGYNCYEFSPIHQ